MISQLGIMDDIHSKEERTIKSWTNRKNALDECFQYVIFEKSSKEALAWLHESELNYLNKFQSLSSNKEEMKKLYKEFCDFTDRLKNQQGYVNLLIELSPKLLESSIRYGNNIAMWANKVESRYKEFFSTMSKVQQAHGLQTNNLNMSDLPSSVSFSSAATTTASKPLSDGISSSYNSELIKLDEKPVNQNQEILKQNELKQKMLKKRKNIINELIQTEKSYVQDLKGCLESYCKEFMEKSKELPEYLKDKGPIVFGNLEEIYNFHYKLDFFILKFFNY